MLNFLVGLRQSATALNRSSELLRFRNFSDSPLWRSGQRYITSFNLASSVPYIGRRFSGIFGL